MKNHVASLELSKKLVEVGIELETQLIWVRWKIGKGELKIEPRSYFIHPKEKTSKQLEWYPAPLASELGEVLPQDIWLKGRRYFIKYEKWSDGAWNVNYRFDKNISIIPEVQGTEKNWCLSYKSEPNARAKMLIYLKENKLLKGENAKI